MARLTPGSRQILVTIILIVTVAMAMVAAVLQITRLL